MKHHEATSDFVSLLLDLIFHDSFMTIISKWAQFKQRKYILPVLVPPNVKPVAGFEANSPVPKPTEGADVVAAAVEPKVPKLSPPVELNDKTNKISITDSIFFSLSTNMNTVLS